MKFRKAIKIAKYQIFTCLLLTACISEVREYEMCETDQLDQAVSYSLEVAPIIRSTCTLPACHINGFENGDFTNFNQLKGKVDNGLLETVITTSQMPPAFTKGPKQLTYCEKKLIIRWIDEGGLNN
ncbi:hypothetical protein QQ020_12550 [Fulvivirgaceae bacterium BMA12]|uniref:Lipoprotein n=1 Tax=Agaribacillus aureus TaxID=3051825 RepID=A0ABT8L554_9BACT|nr:hypothetical protein [Fulvivirgaceae bacterium BMA12]